MIAQSAGTIEYTDCIFSRSKTLSTNVCPGYDTKQSDGEVTVMLWGMRCIPSLPSLPGSL